VTDAGLGELAKMPSLEVLILIGCDVTDAGLLALAGAPSLQRLHVSDAAISLEGGRALERLMPRLVVVRTSADEVHELDAGEPDIHLPGTPLLP
jgi:hypothetical protein